MSDLNKSGHNIIRFNNLRNRSPGDAGNDFSDSSPVRGTKTRNDGTINRPPYRRSRTPMVSKALPHLDSSDEESVTPGSRKFSSDDVSNDSTLEHRSDALDTVDVLTNRALSIKGYDINHVRRVGIEDFELKVDSMGKITSNKAFMDLSSESNYDDRMFSLSNVKVAEYGRFITLYYNEVKKGHAIIEGRFIYTAPCMRDFFSLFTTRVINNICVISGHDTKKFIALGRRKLKDGMTVTYWATDSLGSPVVSGHTDVYRDKKGFYIHAHSTETLIGAPLFCTRTNKLVGILYSQEFARPFRCEVSPVLVPGIDTTEWCHLM